MEQLNRPKPIGNNNRSTTDDDEQLEVPKLDIKLMDKITQALTEEPVFDETIYHECCNCGMAPHAAGRSLHGACCRCWGTNCHTIGTEFREERRSGDVNKVGRRGLQ